MTMRLSAAQLGATTILDRNLAVVAGAGSGKTFVLVERFINLLNEYPGWRLNQIVAVTYTNKAAQEMRDRVRTRLQAVLVAAPDHAAREKWAARLDEIDSARISTIHALCTDLLRANAAEAAIDPAFAVLDEAEASILAADAVRGALIDAARDPSCAALFAAYRVSQIEEVVRKLLRTSAALSPAMLDAAALPDDAARAAWVEATMTRWQTEWEAIASLAFAALADAVEIAVSDPPFGIPANDKRADQWRTAHQAAIDLRSAHVEIAAAALEALCSLNFQGGSAKAWTSEAVFAQVKSILERLRNQAREIRGQVMPPPGDADRVVAALLPAWAHVMTMAGARYQQAKTDRAALDFDDLEVMTRNLLTQHPETRARYAEGDAPEFRHLLIDEFQDTNENQWAILSALAGSAPDADGAAALTAGRLFVVGDPKQSIYQFRGADVQVFGRVVDHIAGAGGERLALLTSYRTHRPLVDRFNALFALLLDPTKDGNPYAVTFGDGMQAHRERAPLDIAEPPPLELMLAEYRANETDDDDGPNDRAHGVEAETIARCITAWVGARVIYDKEHKRERPAEPGDFALLLRRKSKIEYYEAALRAHGVPFVTLSGKGYYDRQEVWDVLNLLRALDNPADSLSLAAALRSPLFNLSDDALFALRFSPDGSAPPLLWDAMDSPAMLACVPDDDRPRVEFACQTLAGLRALAGRIPVAELLREAFERTWYPAVLAGLPDAARRRLNIEKLIEKARSGGRVMLGDFARYLSHLGTQEVREGDAALDATDSVKLMTIHSSKGLEFPIVFLPETAQIRSRSSHGDGYLLRRADGDLSARLPTPPGGDSKAPKPFAYRREKAEEDRREEAEDRRLFYVAATRAQDALILTGQAQVKKKPDDPETPETPIVIGDGWLSDVAEAIGARVGLMLGSVEGDARMGEGSLTVRMSFTRERETLASAPQPSADRTLAAWPIITPDPQAKAPPLTRRVRVQRGLYARSMTATHIASLGEAYTGDDENQRRQARDQWRRAVLHEAPERLPSLKPIEGGALSRLTGEIVHDALRWWEHHDDRARPLDDSINEAGQRMQAYLWERGIFDEQTRGLTLGRALRLFRRAVTSDVQRWIDESSQVYREIPFVFETAAVGGGSSRQIHGIMDVLLQRPDGSWVVIDYKTSYVGIDFDRHAKRYELQVGIYAAAAREALGLAEAPATFIHYIQHSRTIEIHAEAWTAALESLEMMIGRLVDDG